MSRDDIIFILRQLKYKIEDTRYFSGMCAALISFGDEYILDRSEVIMMKSYLISHRPKRTACYGYWWKPGLKEPRLKWIDRRIRIEKWKIKLGFDYFEILFSLLKF